MDETRSCWCCGRPRRAADILHLGARPEASVCLDCAHHLHQRARAREDERHPSTGTRARDVLRAGRATVIERQWHEKRGVGPVLRRLGRHLP